MSKQKINPFLWFDKEAEDAANLYASTFKDGRVTSVNRNDKGVFIVTFTVAGLEFTAMNAGSMFSPNASISFFVNCETAAEIEHIWEKLSDRGTPMMPLDKYPFSEKYGWIQDKYGVSWQLSLTHQPQSIAPALLFSGSVQGRAEEAIDLYRKEFPNSKVNMLARYEPGEHGPEGKLKYASFTILGQNFVAMDSGRPMDIPFTPGISLFLSCETQEEVDHYWEELSASGGRKDQCGWLQDRFGVSWQVVPTLLAKLMSDKDPKRSKSVMAALMKMKKIEMKELQDAYDNA